MLQFALSTVTLAMLFSAAASGQPSGLVAHWTFDELPGASLTDISGNKSEKLERLRAAGKEMAIELEMLREKHQQFLLDIESLQKELADETATDTLENVGVGLESVTAVSLPTIADLDDGLLLHYPLDGDASDLSGSGNDGTIVGAVRTEDRSGLSSGALHFDGNSYITVPDNISFGTASFTFAAWFKQDGTLPYRALISKHEGKTGNNDAISLYSTWGPPQGSDDAPGFRVCDNDACDGAQSSVSYIDDACVSALRCSRQLDFGSDRQRCTVPGSYR